MKDLLKRFAVLAMAASLAACSSGGADTPADDGGETSDGPVKGGTYVIAQDSDPATLNPDGVADDFNYAIVQNMYNRLYKLTNAFTAVPDLATSYDLSDDALTYTFHLVEDAVWTDGEPITSDDVLYTFNEIIDKHYAFESVFANVESMEAPDEHTVVFHMTQPEGSFVYNLAWYGTFILPKHALEGTDWLEDDLGTNPVTSGPFKLDVWNRGQDIQLVPNESYFGDQPYLDRVIYTTIPEASTQYQSWLNGEIDEMSAVNIPSNELQGIIDDTDNYYTVAQIWPSPWYFTFNLEEGPFADPKVREAMLYGIDREDVSQKATGGFKPKTDYFIPDIYTEYLNDDAKEPEYDLEKAQALLEEAGYTKDADGYYFETTFTVMGGFDDFCTVIADNMEKMGIKVKLDVQDYSIWEENCLDNYNFTITALAGFEGPDVLGTTRRWTSNGAVNVARYSNPEVDELAAKASAASSDEELQECMKKIQEILRQDIPLVMCLTYADYQPFHNYIHGNPYVSTKDGGSMEIAGFSELTYVWVDAKN